MVYLVKNGGDSGSLLRLFRGESADYVEGIRESLARDVAEQLGSGAEGDCGELVEEARKMLETSGA